MARVAKFDAASTLTRLVSVVVLILAFIATKPITLQNVDSLLIVALVIAAIAGAGLAFEINRNADLNWPSVTALARAASIIAGCLAILAILRTVLPLFVGQYEDEILGLAFIALLLIVFAFTEGGEAPEPAVAPAAGAPAVAAPVTDPSNPGGGSSGGSEGAQSNSGPSRIGIVGTVCAILVVVGYGLLIALLIQKSSASADEWARLIGIQGGLEAAAFAALGALIGVTVQGRAVDAAQQQAQTAQVAADDAAAEADGLQGELDGKVDALKSQAESLTALERTVSDTTVPHDVRELPLHIEAEGIRQIQQIHGNSMASQDEVLERIRTLRDEAIAASTSPSSARRRRRAR